MTRHKIGGIRFLYFLGIVLSVWLPSIALAQTPDPVYFKKYQDRVKEDIQKNRETLRLNPNDALAWALLGSAYGTLNRHQEAIQAYREALRIKPDESSAWYCLGEAYAVSGNRSAALDAVKELRRYHPKWADDLFNEIIRP
jgi:cytochrome c-type biogenesis protein CcmH/NrfG